MGEASENKVIDFSELPMSVPGNETDLHAFVTHLLNSNTHATGLVLGLPNSHVVTSKVNTDGSKDAICEYGSIAVKENGRVIGHLPGPINFRFHASMDGAPYTLTQVDTANTLLANALPSLQAASISADDIRGAMVYNYLYQVTKQKLVEPLQHEGGNAALNSYLKDKVTFASKSGSGSILVADLGRELNVNGELVRIANKASSEASPDEKIAALQQATQWSDEDIAHLKQAYTQDPAQLIPVVVAHSLQSSDQSDSLLILGPGGNRENGNRKTNLFKKDNEIYVQSRFESLPVIDRELEDENTGQPPIVGHIRGPAEANFKLVQTTPDGKWAFELIDVKTNNPFIADALRGKMHNENDVRKQIGLPPKPALDAEIKIEPKPTQNARDKHSSPSSKGFFARVKAEVKTGVKSALGTSKKIASATSDKAKENLKENEPDKPETTSGRRKPER